MIDIHCTQLTFGMFGLACLAKLVNYFDIISLYNTVPVITNLAGICQTLPAYYIINSEVQLELKKIKIVVPGE